MLPDSPFTPAHPATPELFTGREDLIQKIHQVARRCANRRHVEMVFVCGERGMGKSSLAQNARRGLGDEFIGAEVNLGGVKTIEQAFNLTWRALLKNNHKRSQVANFFSKIGMKARINIIGLVEVMLDKKSDEFSQLLQEGNFADALAALAKASGSSVKGIVIVWDDINGLAELPEFAMWLKRFAESNAKAPVLLIVSGVEERRQKIIENNPSADRIFHSILDVKPWSDKESLDFLCKGLTQGGLPKRVMQKYLPYLRNAVDACQGVPVLAQEIGDAIWQKYAEWQGNHEKGKKQFSPYGSLSEAAISIGRKRLEKDIVSALGSEDYIRLLRALRGISKGLRFSRQKLMSSLPRGISETQVIHFLNRMRKLGALTTLPNSRGMYCFPNFLYYTYLCHLSPAVRNKREQ